MKERLTKALNLSKEQQQKLDAIFADTRQQMQALSEQERQTKGPRIREATRGRIREILSAEQRAKYDEMSPGEGRSDRGDRGGAASAPGRVYIMDGEKLKPMSLALGISDGTSTEILRGDLKEGQEVVTGTAGKQSGGLGGGGSSPRLRL
jgi:HlyD family secretion protein